MASRMARWQSMAAEDWSRARCHEGWCPERERHCPEYQRQKRRTGPVHLKHCRTNGSAVQLNGESGNTVCSELAARGGGGVVALVVLVGKNLVRTDEAAWLHRGAVALTVEIVGETRLANILEVGRRYDKLVMRFSA